jgi:hypothetical protein
LRIFVNTRSASANVLPDPAEAFIISKAGVKKKC